MSETSPTKKTHTNLGLSQGQLVHVIPVDLSCCEVYNFLRLRLLMEMVGHVMVMEVHLSRKWIYMVQVPESVYGPMKRYYVPEVLS